MKLLRATFCATLLLVINTVAHAQTFTQLQWGINRGATPSPFGVMNGSALLSQVGKINTTTGDYFLPQTAINLTGLPDKPNGSRGPLFIWNNPSTTSVGQTAGQQIWIGNNPTATPGANDTIAQSLYVDNFNGRTGTWANNTICNQGPVSAGGGVGIAHCHEIDVLASQTISTTQSVFNAIGPAVHGTEYVASQNTGASPYTPQAAVWIWGATNDSAQQWLYGLACTRYNIACIIGETITGDTQAASYLIWDKHVGSAATLKISGSPTAAIDLSDNPTLTYFIRGSSTTTTDLVFDNNANFAQQITVSAGSTVSQNASIALADKGQARKWGIIKDTSNNLVLQNAVTAHNALQFSGATDIGTFFASPVIPLAAGYIKSTGATNQLSSAATIPLTDLATQATNTIVGNATAGSAAPTALAIGTCSAATSALTWTTNSGFGCNTLVAGVANPTATIGLTVVNGTATSAMRSDAAPPLSQSIVPTWTGIHTFSAAPVFSLGAKYSGSSSGTVTVVASATAGTPTITWGNASGTPAVTASAPLALSTTTGNMTVTGAAGQVLAGSTPAFTATPTLGVAGSAIGTLALAGNTSGTATITPQATAGSPTLTLPNASGTFAVSATGPIAVSATTGNVTCTTCVTSSGGGAITGTAPVAVSAAGAVSITGAAGQVLAGASPAFTATPTLGVAGSTVGSLAFANATSGSVTLQPVTGALGSAVLSLPATTSTVAVTGNNLSAFAATTSAQLAGVISDETGSGALVFATSPTLVTPTLGAATAATINKVTVTAPASAATLTVADGASLITSGAFATTLTSTATTNSTLPAGTHTLAGLDVSQTWSAAQSFNSSDLKLNGATSGAITLNAAATAGSNTITLPAGTTDFSATGGSNQVVKQASSGGAFTVGTLACANLSDGATGCSNAIGTSGATIPLLSTANTWSLAQSITGTSGLLLTVGSTSGAVSTGTPVRLQLDGSYSSAAGANPKISLLNNLAPFGFGVSAGSLDYMTDTAAAHTFYVNASKVAVIDGNGFTTNIASAMISSSTNWSNGAAASSATLTNAPAAGNPTKWIPVNDNGTTRYIPAW